MSLILKQYKSGDGVINVSALASIPVNERIPELAKKDFQKINMLIVAGLTMAFESMNLKRGMNALQILDLSEAIIDTSEEDNLSLEDVMLFLQFMVRGKYELSYESMDIPKFMRIFEMYREERHSTYMGIIENKHLEYKSMGDATRSYKDDPLSEHFSRLGDTMSRLKEDLRETRKENNYLKQADKL